MWIEAPAPKRKPPVTATPHNLRSPRPSSTLPNGAARELEVGFGLLTGSVLSARQIVCASEAAVRPIGGS